MMSRLYVCIANVDLQYLCPKTVRDFPAVSWRQLMILPQAKKALCRVIVAYRDIFICMSLYYYEYLYVTATSQLLAVEHLLELEVQLQNPLIKTTFEPSVESRTMIPIPINDPKRNIRIRRPR